MLRILIEVLKKFILKQTTFQSLLHAATIAYKQIIK